MAVAIIAPFLSCSAILTYPFLSFFILSFPFLLSTPPREREANGQEIKDQQRVAMSTRGWPVRDKISIRS